MICRVAWDAKNGEVDHKIDAGRQRLTFISLQFVIICIYFALPIEASSFFFYPQVSLCFVLVSFCGDVSFWTHGQLL